jgi:hypothetical protein
VTTTHGAAAALAQAAYASGLAPSVFNTQPWRWRVHPEWLDLYADRSRQLPVTDPAGRLLTVSCGAALHHARVALAAEGWRGAERLCPSSDNPDHLARVGPLEYVGVTPEAMRRFQAAQRRRSDRRPLTGSTVPRELLGMIRAAVESERAHLHLLRDDEVSDLASAAAHADTLASADEALRAELRFWVGGVRSEGTGVPDTAIPTDPATGPVPHRDLGPSGTLATLPEADRAATYAVIFGEWDTTEGWLLAGQALSAAWLAGTEHGVAVLPFSAPMEVPVTRTILRRLLAGIGHPYLVLRLGMTDPDHPGPPHTPRLEPTQVVEIVEPDQ